MKVPTDWDAALEKLIDEQGRPPLEKAVVRDLDDGKLELHFVLGKEMNVDVIDMALRAWMDMGLPTEQKVEGGPPLPADDQTFSLVRASSALLMLFDGVREATEVLLEKQAAYRKEESK